LEVYMTNKLPPHPMQPLVQDAFGTVRFRENKIVSFLLDRGPYDLNKLCVMDWPEGDYTQLMQLIGYSVSGYGELSSSPRDLTQRADAEAAALREGRVPAEPVTISLDDIEDPEFGGELGATVRGLVRAFLDRHNLTLQRRS
jgi:hypothetical protein